MTQKSMKSPKDLLLPLQLKNTASCFDNKTDRSSQPNSIDSPNLRRNKGRFSNSLKFSGKKKAPSMKLDFLLDVNEEKEDKNSVLSKTLKSFSNIGSISPPHREIKSTKASNRLHLSSCCEKQHNKLAELDKTNTLKELCKDFQINSKKTYLSGQFEIPSDTEKPLETQIKGRFRADSSDDKRLQNMTDIQNKETQRLSKLRKTRKLLSVDKGGQNSRYPLFADQSTHQSYNFHNSLDNSVSSGGIKTMGKVFTHNNKENINLNLPASLSSPKQNISNANIKNFDYFSKLLPKEKLKSKKNYSLSETMQFDSNHKAYLNYKSPSNKWQQGHRKLGSTDENIFNNLGKSLKRGESCYNMNAQISPNALEKNRPIKSSMTDVPREKYFTFEEGESELQKKAKSKVDAGLEYLNGLKHTFEALIENYDTQIVDAQANQNVMKKIKTEYETLIESLISANQKLRGTKDDKNKENEDSNIIFQENARLKQEMSDLKLELENVREILKNTSNSSPCQSVLPTEKRVLNAQHESPPLTKHHKETSEKTENEITQFKRVILEQQHSIATLKKRGAKMMRLMYALRKQGIDVERIYNEEVKGKFEHLAQEDGIKSHSKSKSITANMLRKTGYSTSNVPSKDHLSEVSENESGFSPDEIKQKKAFIGGSTPKEDSEETNFHKTKMNPLLKNKLKLDFTALKKSIQEGNVKEKQVGPDGFLGFHEEFMSKFDEFSQSWREASKLQKINN